MCERAGGFLNKRAHTQKLGPEVCWGKEGRARGRGIEAGAVLFLYTRSFASFASVPFTGTVGDSDERGAGRFGGGGSTRGVLVLGISVREVRNVREAEAGVDAEDANGGTRAVVGLRPFHSSFSLASNALLGSLCPPPFGSI